MGGAPSSSMDCWISSMPEGLRSTGTRHLAPLASEQRTSRASASYSRVSVAFWSLEPPKKPPLVSAPPSSGGKRAWREDSAMGSSTKRWTARRRGRAPKRTSVADSRMAALRETPTATSRWKVDATRSATSARFKSRMSTKSVSESASNDTISSRRFRNSGRNLAERARLTSERRRFSESWSPANVARMLSEPTLVVKMTMQFVKSTRRPLASWTWPSSRRASMTFQRSGCAFSISSNNSKECGRRRTAFVNCPPSSKPT
mmetsp:Transcript_11971/g.35989  ORF Transcript_11971/g.35989 Transcript_11971/m.35989 type:complete len:260 (-) Transcript_11971:1345-2124(-)